MTYDEEVLADEPCVYWKLDETSGTTATDESGNSQDGTYTGSYVQDADPIHSESPALTLNASGTYNGAVYKNPVASGSWPLDALSIEIWMRATTAASSGSAAIVSYASTGSADDFELLYQSAGTNCFRLCVNGAANFITFANAPGGACAATAPKHVVVTWDGATGESILYINGELAQVHSTLLSAGHSISVFGSLYVGQEQDSIGGGLDTTQALRATVSHMAIYDEVLTSERIKAHFDAAVDTVAITAYDFGPVVETADTAPPTIEFSTASPIDDTDSLTVVVTEDIIGNLTDYVYVDFSTRTELVFDGVDYVAPYSASADVTGGTTHTHTISRTGGWPSNFTLRVRADDGTNVVTDSQAYVVTGASDNYPPHMDPYT
jgi:hypothetical protein